MFGQTRRSPSAAGLRRVGSAFLALVVALALAFGGVASEALAGMSRALAASAEIHVGGAGNEFSYGEVKTVDGSVGTGFSLIGIMIVNTAPEGVGASTFLPKRKKPRV